ncbi:hypothetical protein VNO80_00636 [Phaseolus coccineus]|uniref:Uncharacterized protein n=1 Tax=Phaseolus coccineus TaxID=3886 RepID=A0AAN9RQW7_PHACN
MSRSRLLWFTFGFASSYAVFSQCVLKDLLVQSNALSSHFEHEFRVLETRISQIESSSPKPSSVLAPPSASDQVEGK